ncbi:unnamed protein product [Adineta ricciae]|uniref:NAD(P)(+)--arginine ADP-ribosyltransferase n=1 Tax=Adineta ricciae TaxID=249248 RepID=A0A814MZC1_ADIRI|nr:unnamed protein product [Adineta ricciae]
MENRFVDTSDTLYGDESTSPIYGYQDQVITTLEEAIQGIRHEILRIDDYVTQAKKKYKRPCLLTEDEFATIYLYTMTSSGFSSRLNSRLRAMDKEPLKPWFPYLKFFITALNKLPSFKGIVWRGISKKEDYNLGDIACQTRWDITSTTKDLKVSELFFGEAGILYVIKAVNGKDISKYSANPDEKEVILMPGTRIQLETEPFVINNESFIYSFEECTSIPQGKHVMLSYENNDKAVVLQIYQYLHTRSIPVWFDENISNNNIYDSLAIGVKNAAFVVCFLSPEYESSARSQIELQYAQKCYKKIVPCLTKTEETWRSIGWLSAILEGVKQEDFRHFSPSDDIDFEMDNLLWTLQNMVYVPEENSERLNIRFELIKYQYLCNSKIERFMNPAVTFPIDQSYINLAIVETKETREKEEKLKETQNIGTIIDTYEDIYGSKTPIEVEDIFEKCKDQNKRILVFGRAGIGKSTFCRYAAYQWATGAIWPEYELVVLVPLRSLTGSKYNANKEYNLVDILINQYFFDRSLPVEEKNTLENKIHTGRILWLLDGYDEIVQETSSHLQNLLERLLKTPHHIVTSRPYMNTLSYFVHMEITGFTEENINNYIELFFNQLDNSSHQGDNLLNFLRSKPRIWGIAHIPINLELICSTWSNIDWTQTKTVTITVLYDRLAEWICRRYLEKQKKMSPIKTNRMNKTDVYDECRKELAFLENLAFLGMENNVTLLGPQLLKKAQKESRCKLNDCPDLFNVGLLKSYDSNSGGIGTRITADKHYYFVHLSFQEHFAARYLANALSNSTRDQAKQFIREHKYNQRYQLLFIFLSGLINDDQETNCNRPFWDAILNDPLDIIGARHLALIIQCLDETALPQTFIQSQQLLEKIMQWLEYALRSGSRYLTKLFDQTLSTCNAICNEPRVQQTIVRLLNNQQLTNRHMVFSFISKIPLTNPIEPLLLSLRQALRSDDVSVRSWACDTLGGIGEKAATKEVMDGLLEALTTGDNSLRSTACDALSRMGKKAATKEVIDALIEALRSENDAVRSWACDALVGMGEKAATKQVIDRLVEALRSENDAVRSWACNALGRMGEKAATKEVIERLVEALRSDDNSVRSSSCEALVSIGEKAATKEVIDGLVQALRSDNDSARTWACYTLDRIGDNAATKEVIDGLVAALRSDDNSARSSACEALVGIGEKAATKEVIDGLVEALRSNDESVRSSACNALGGIGDKAATKEVIDGLVDALRSNDESVRSWACNALGRIGEKAATNEVIDELVEALRSDNDSVRSSACNALGRMGENAATKEVIDGLVEALRSNDESVRSWACNALGCIGDKAATKEVIDGLVEALRSNDESVRTSACNALGGMGEKAATKEVMDGLLESLTTYDNSLRSSACDALSRMGKKAATKEVIDALIEALWSENDAVRSWACHALVRMAGKAATKELIDGLIKAFRSENDAVISLACFALLRMGKKAAAKEVIDRLLDVLRSDDKCLRKIACVAFGRMGEKAATKQVIEGLVEALMSRNDSVRRLSCYALDHMGERQGTKKVIDGLVEALRSDNDSVRSRACEAVGRMGEEAAMKEVIDGLLEALRSEDESVRSCACGALGRMGEKAAAKEVIVGLTEALRSYDEYVRSSACYALVDMAEKVATKEAIDGLFEALRSDDKYVRSSACDALVDIGEKAATKEVIDGLVEALRSDDNSVRTSACGILCRMGEKAATKEVIISLDWALVCEWSNKQESLSGYTWMMGERVRYYLIVMSALGVFWDSELQIGDAGEIAMDCVQRQLISPVRLVKVYMERGEQMFLRGAIYACVITETALAIHGSCLCIYDREGVRKVSIPPGSESLVDELRKGAFRAIGQLDLKVHIDWNRPGKRELSDNTNPYERGRKLRCRKYSK